MIAAACFRSRHERVGLRIPSIQLFATASLLVTLVLHGCKSDTAIGESSIILSLRTLETPPTLDTSSYDLASPREQVFDRYVGEDSALPIIRLQQQTDRYNAAIETSDIVDKQPVRTLYWSRNDAGDYTLHATIEHNDNALTVFDPPLLLLPAAMVAGEPVTMQSSMRVLRADNPRRQREQGTATQTITFLDRREIRTPHETIAALCFEIEFHADLRFADIRETTIIYRAENGVVIAEQTRQRISLLGLPPSDEETTLVRR